MLNRNVKLHPVFTIGRWTARILGSLLLLLIFVIMTGSFFSEGLAYEISAAENWMFFAMFLMLIGTIVGWKYEGYAALLLIAGYLLFVGVNYTRNQTFNVGWVIPIFLIVGILYLMCWVRDRKTE